MNFAVLQFPGSNCDQDVVHVLRNVLGHSARLLWHKESSLGAADAVIVPGGFSYGDYLRTGAIARFSPVMEAVQGFAANGGLVLGHLQWLPDSLRGRAAARGADSQPLAPVPLRAHLPEDRHSRFARSRTGYRRTSSCACPSPTAKAATLPTRQHWPGSRRTTRSSGAMWMRRAKPPRPPIRTARWTASPASATSAGTWPASCRTRSVPASRSWAARTGAWCWRA